MKQFKTISRNGDFKRIYARAKSYVSPCLVTYVFFKKTSEVRYGITTGKKIGNAVKRNRARRVIYAAFRELDSRFERGCDIVFVARVKTPHLKSQVVMKQMEKHLKSAGIIK